MDGVSRVKGHLEGFPFRKPVISVRLISSSAAATEAAFFFAKTECRATIYARVTSSYLFPAATDGRATRTPACCCERVPGLFAGENGLTAWLHGDGESL